MICKRVSSILTSGELVLSPPLPRSVSIVTALLLGSGELAHVPALNAAVRVPVDVGGEQVRLPVLLELAVKEAVAVSAHDALEQVRRRDRGRAARREELACVC